MSSIIKPKLIPLAEYVSFDQGHLNLLMEEEGEGDAKKKSLFMEGIFIQGDVKNLNQRVYPSHEIKNAVQALQEYIKRGEPVLGELDHPSELTINLDRVSHLITKMWMEGSTGYGKLKILDTPCGNTARTLLEAGAKLGVSSRGSGNVDSRGHVSDFEIITVDIVARPSGPDCYPKAVYEALQYGRRANVIRDLAETMTHDPKAQAHLKKELIHWIRTLK